MDLIDSSEQRKARGAFFTPPDLGRFLAKWAVRSPNDAVLEPSCGEAALLLEAGLHRRSLGGTGVLRGVDIHAPSVTTARELLAANGLDAELNVQGFFELPPSPSFDVVIGNPPYVRYQSFAGEDRLKAQAAALAGGVRLGGLANAWAAFVVHAAAFLKPGGRLALVLPAVLMSVNYAAPVRRFLLRRFRSVSVLMFEERVFPGVIEEVVLLLAEGEGPTDKFDLFQVRNLEQLGTWGGLPQQHARACAPATADGKWTEALLPENAADAYSALIADGKFTKLVDWGETDLGMVTGNNKYFTLTTEDVARLGLRENELMKISPPGSKHLRGLEFSTAAFKELAKAGERVFLFYPDANPSAAAKRYIAEGEKLGVQSAYKCSVRDPWWRVPTVCVPDLFLTYMNQDAPRLVSNGAKAAYLNSVHGVTLRPKLRKLGRDLLPIGMLNSLSMLGAELEGRSYGGGILKIEPKEADRLPVPSPQVLEAAADELRALRPQLGRHLRNSDLDAVVKQVDEILLHGQLRLPLAKIAGLRAARDGLAARRASRAGKSS